MNGFSPQHCKPLVDVWKCLLLAALCSGSILQAQVVTQIRDSGPRQNRINLVILSEGYTAPEMETKFAHEARRLMEGFLNTEPYREFQNYINVFTIAVASGQSGSDHPSRKFFVDTYFNSSFGSDGSITIPSDYGSGPAQGYRKLIELLDRYVPEHDIYILSVNDPQYGGSSAVVSAHPDAPALALWGSATLFARLLPEVESPTFRSAVEGVNITSETRRDRIRWKHWILPSTPIPTPETSAYAGVVGLFEGASYQQRDIFRPKLSCKMREIREPFCEVCAEAIVLNIYKRLSLIDRVLPGVRDLTIEVGETAHFSLVTLQPLSHSVSVQWLVDGTPVAGANGSEFSLAAANLGLGAHVVRANVTDSTAFVRADPDNDLQDTTSWNLEVAAGSGAPVAPLLNLSTRAQVESGDRLAIGGFILRGSAPKKVAVRALGPSLRRAGITSALADPTLMLQNASRHVVATNDNWRAGNAADLQAAGLAPHDDLESALIVTLEPGAYTALVRRNGDASGIALVEVYDLEPNSETQLVNLSTRGVVGSGDAVMIGGLIVGATESARANVVLRAIGPSLSNAGIVDALQDPTLQLRNADGLLVMENDNWQDVQRGRLESLGLQPGDTRESAVIATLPPGAYTVIVGGKNNASGVGLIEIYTAR